jgi:drug/metabolite transporter (DMT)-like permease
LPASALALVLAAALLHAFWNIVTKKVGGDLRFSLFVSLTTLVLWAPLGIWAGWDAVPRWGALEWALVFASGVVHLFYFGALLRGYRLSDLTVVYPVARGTGPLVSALGAIVLLGESVSVAGAVGIAAVVGGVFLVAGGPGLWSQAHDVSHRQRVRLGVGYGALTGLLIAGYTLIDGYAVKVVLISPILVDYFGHLTRVPFMLPLALRNRAEFWRVWRSQWRAALVVAIAGPLAYVLVLYAVQLAPLSHVAPAREVSMLFAALLGGHLLGESNRGWRLAGSALMVCGVVALAWG